MTTTFSITNIGGVVFALLGQVSISAFFKRIHANFFALIVELGLPPLHGYVCPDLPSGMILRCLHGSLSLHSEFGLHGLHAR